MRSERSERSDVEERRIADKLYITKSWEYVITTKPWANFQFISAAWGCTARMPLSWENFACTEAGKILLPYIFLPKAKKCLPPHERLEGRFFSGTTGATAGSVRSGGKKPSLLKTGGEAARRGGGNIICNPKPPLFYSVRPRASKLE